MRRLPYRTFREWQAFDQLSPIGGMRLEVGLAMLTMIVANMLRSSDSAALPLSDFLWFHPFGGKANVAKKSTAELKAKLTAVLGPPMKVKRESRR